MAQAINNSQGLEQINSSKEKFQFQMIGTKQNFRVPDDKGQTNKSL